MAALMIPLVINGAGLAAAAAAAQGLGVVNVGLGRKMEKMGQNSNRNSTILVESYCLEMLSCEANNFLRGSKWSNWVTRWVF